MEPSGRQGGNSDYLSAPFVAVPCDLLRRFAQLGLHPHELVVLLQILASGQTEGMTELSPHELGERCGMSSKEVMACVERLVTEGFLAIGERYDDQGAHVTYFDLQPLWDKLKGRRRMVQPQPAEKDLVSLFEEEFGRPLSSLECDQLRAWLGDHGYPEWLVIEALKESVLANKYSFRYIDRVLYTWQKNNVRSRQDLENYRAQYRERQAQLRSEAQAAQSKPRSRPAPARTGTREPVRDERYASFYELFPD